MSPILSIYKALHILLPRSEMVDNWPSRDNSKPTLAGRKPFERMLSG